MAPGPSPTSWRTLCAQHLGQLAETLERQVEVEVQSRVSTAVDGAIETAVVSAVNRSRREVSDQLNQSVRRLRQCATSAEIPAALADAARIFAERTAAFTIENRVARWQGPKAPIEIPLVEAPAFRAVVESRDPVVAMGGNREVSMRLFEALRQEPEEKVYLFPLVARQEVVAVLCAAGSVHASALELLAGVAALQLEFLAGAVPQKPAGLVTISGSVGKKPANGAAKAAGKWWELTAQERQAHLAAQRFARVRVAEMRLLHSDAVREGRSALDLYQALQEPIDAARDGYRLGFMAATPSMVDYLHLELLRSLAQDDPQMLGPEYPGALA